MELEELEKVIEAMKASDESDEGLDPETARALKKRREEFIKELNDVKMLTNLVRENAKLQAELDDVKRENDTLRRDLDEAKRNIA